MRTTASLLAAAILAVSSATVVAAPGNGANGVAPGQNKDILMTLYGAIGSPTPSGSVNSLGQAISGGFYGNTSNAGDSPYAPDSGHGVTPSISPGPQVVGGDGPGSGTSVGDAIQALR
jgi:hypothetical protein